MRGPIVTVTALVLAAVMVASCGDEGPSGSGTRLVLEPEEGVQVADLDSALDGARKVIERRVEEFGVAGARVKRTDQNRIVVELPGVAFDEAIRKIGRTALLQFCEPVMDQTGNVAVVSEGVVQYQPQTCEPLRDPEGSIVVEGGAIEFVPWARSGTAPAANNPPTDQIVWQPAKAELDGVETALTGRFLRTNTFVFRDPVLGRPILTFEWDGTGSDVSEAVTERLAERNYPLAPFLDGEPILGEDGRVIAPSVQGIITSQGQVSGLSANEAQELSTLLNTGAFPVPLRVVEVEEVTD